MKTREFLSFLNDKIVLKDLAKFLGGAISVAVILDAFEDKLPIPSWWFEAIIFIGIASIIPYLIFRVHDRKMELDSGEKYSFKFNWKENLSKFLVIYTFLSLLLLSFFIAHWSSFEYLYGKKFKQGLVLVDDFENLTGSDDLGKIGGRTKHAIIWSLDHIDVRVVQSRQLDIAMLALEDDRISSMGLSSDPLWKYTGHEFIITGKYSFVNDSTVELTSWIADANYNRLRDFEVITIDIGNFLDPITKLAHHITGYWTVRGKELNLKNPAIWESRENWMNALNNWPDYEKVLPYLERSMENDPDFFRAQFLYCSYLRNEKRYSEMDSLVSKLALRKDEMNKKDQNLLNFYSSDVDGDLKNALAFFKNDYLKDEKNWFYNTSMAIYYLNYGNDPESALNTLNKIDYEYSKSSYHLNRLQARIDALLRLGRISDALEYIKQYESFEKNRIICMFKARALVQQGNIEEIMKFYKEYSYEKIKEKDRSIDSLDILYYIVKEGYTANKVSILNHFGGVFENQFDMNSIPLNKSLLGYAIYYFTGKQDLIKSSDQYVSVPFLKYKLGEETLDTIELNKKISHIPKFNYGQKKYEYAQLALAAGHDDFALKLLIESYHDGNQFTSGRFTNDPLLRDLFDNTKFKELTKPRRLTK
jgi:hypothetical protein